MRKITQLLSFAEKNLLFFLSLFLIAFIPLFPKIPIADIIPGYIVRVRYEDLIIGVTGLVWLKDVLLKRINWKSDYFVLVCIYVLAGLLSIILGWLLQQTIPGELLHLGKSGLTLFRYMEYFSLFFFLYGSIRHRVQVKIALVVLTLTLLGVVAYGFGQKYFNLPLYSTMNREYSKGERLYLQPGARVQSTFAGHYDLAGYLLLVLPLIFALSLTKVSKNKVYQATFTLALQVCHASGLWLLIESGSKTALLAYGVGLGLVVLLKWWQLPSIKLKMTIGASAGLLGLVVISGIFIILPSSSKQAYLNIISEKLTSSTQDRPLDLVGENSEYKLVASTSAEGKTYYVPIVFNKEWSQNALRYGLSIGIRLDTLWPRAIRGWGYNPITGAGYGTLASLDTALFAEADSTDNNYLRILGETGILGLITFFGLILIVLWKLARNINHQDKLLSGLSIGLIGSTIGILLDGVLIDVFAASKIAFTFWALAGIVLSLDSLVNKKHRHEFTQKLIYHFKGNWMIYVSILIFILAFHQNIFRRHNLTKSFIDHHQAVEQVTLASCYMETGKFELCRPSGQSMSTGFTLYSRLLSIVNINRYHPSNFYLLNMIIITFLLAIFTFVAKKMKFESSQILLGNLFILGIAFWQEAAYRPLEDRQLLILVLATIGSILFFKLLKLNKNIRQINIAVLSILVLLAVFKLPADILNRFRFRGELDSLRLIENSNAFFRDNNNSPILVSQINPYYADQFSNRRWQLLPISTQQVYFEDATQVWGQYDFSNLDSIYSSIIASQPLFISNFQSRPDFNMDERIKELKSKFNFNYKLLGCNERCNIYQLNTYQDPINKPIMGINHRVFDANYLPEQYQISILNLQYPISSDSNIFGTTQMANWLKPIINSTPQLSIFTGDLTHIDSGIETKILNINLLNRLKFPVLFTPGNLASRPKPTGNVISFFTPTEYYLILDFDQSHENFSSLQLQLYDKFLEIEKLKDIKNIVIIDHDLNWQEPETESLLPILQNKLKDFDNLNIYIVSKNHFLEEDSTNHFVQQESSNTTYLGSLIEGTENDSYIRLNANNGEITLEPILINQ